METQVEPKRILLQATLKIEVEDGKTVEAKFTKMVWRYDKSSNTFIISGKQTVNDGTQDWNFIIDGEVNKP